MTACSLRPLCTVTLPSTTFPNYNLYSCSGTADSTGILFYDLSSGSSPAGAWADFGAPSLQRNLLTNPTFASSLSGWTEYGSPLSAITVPSAGETQMYSSSAPINVSLGQSVSVPSGSAFTASVIANTGYTSGAYMTVYDGAFATPLCTVALPKTNYPTWTTYTCSEQRIAPESFSTQLGSGTSPAGAWADFENPLLAIR